MSSIKNREAKPGGKRRQQQKADTRELILESATALFDELGYDKTTIRQIALKAEVAVGTIFLHFTDKFSLLCAALFDELENEISQRLKTMPHDQPVPEQFMHFAKGFYKYWARKPDLSRTLLKGITFVDNNEWVAAFDQQIEKFIAFFAEVLAKAITKGEIRSDVNCQLTALAFWSHYTFTLVLGLKTNFDLPKMEEMLQALIYQTVKGVLKNP